jgi:hypothetical protein
MRRRTATTVLSAALSLSLLLAAAVPVLASAPDNDDFDEATPITSLPFSDAVDTTEATQASDDPECAGAGPTVWYALTLGENAFVEINTFGSSYDTTLSAYVGERGDLQQIACNDDAAGSLQSRIRIAVEAGTTIFIMAGAFASGPGGELILNALETEPFTPIAIELTVDPIGQVDARTGTAWLTGTVSCSGAEFVDLFGSLEQRAGRFIIHGFGFDFLPCDGTTPFELEIRGETGLFAGGRAHAFVEAVACTDDFEDCAFDSVELDVHLRGGRR